MQVRERRVKVTKSEIGGEREHVGLEIDEMRIGFVRT